MLFLGRVPSLETNIAPGKRTILKRRFLSSGSAGRNLTTECFSFFVFTSDVMFFASSYIISGCKLYFQNEGGWLLSYNKHAWGSKKVWCTVNEASITIQAFTSQVPLDVFWTFFTFPRIQELVQKTKKWLHWNSKNLESRACHPPRNCNISLSMETITETLNLRLFCSHPKACLQTSKCIDLVFCFKYGQKFPGTW